MNSESLVKAIIPALIGSVVGWSGGALTLSGRVTAIEQTLQRVESRLDTLIRSGGVNTVEPYYHGKEASPAAPKRRPVS